MKGEVKRFKDMYVWRNVNNSIGYSEIYRGIWRGFFKKDRELIYEYVRQYLREKS